jgi:hypothetical protein|tara:strand:+ start:1547 stop:1651 length:105 start_codon:yes stop_codon:yes gene_type:complete
MDNNDVINELQRDIAAIMYEWYGDSNPCGVVDEE